MQPYINGADIYRYIVFNAIPRATYPSSRICIFIAEVVTLGWIAIYRISIRFIVRV